MANIPLSQLPPDLLYNGQLDVSNPVKQTKYNQLNAAYQQSQPSTTGTIGTSSTSTPNSIDPQQAINNALSAAKSVQQFNIDAAQPQISTLQSNKSNLDTQYQSLLDSIKGDQTLAVNNATKATNATLAARGLSTQDPNAQTQQASAASAAAQPYSSLTAQTGISQAQDENNIAAQIAALQSGNPTEATSSAQGINSIAAQLGQLGIQQQGQNLAATLIPIPGYGIYNTTTGQLMGGLNGVSGNNGMITYTGG
jgi:hypothetical protein